MSEHLTKDAIDLSTLSIPRLFGRYFLPTLFGMLSISAMCAIDGIFVGHAVGADGIGAINICVPITTRVSACISTWPKYSSPSSATI
jgi:Na+-driven multidrug efflux pump